MDPDPHPGEALKVYRDAERAYVDATFPFFEGTDSPTEAHREQVKSLHAALEQARSAYFTALKDAGWSAPLREWSDRPPQLG